jgi:two-component system, cell cycle response regulator
LHESVTTSKARILCVDDEPKNLKLLAAILMPAGYDLIMAENGELALSLIEQQPPDLILLDIMMPGLSGYDVLTKIRAANNSRLIPVIMVTALREVEDRVKALDLGCDDFISKPFDKVEMLARVKSLLRISYYRGQLDEKEKFELLLNQIADMIVVLQGDLGLVRYNQPAQELLQLGQLSGNVIEHLTAKFKVKYQGDLSADIKLRSLTFDVIRPEAAKARALVLEIRSSVIKDPAGGITNIMLLGRNVTEEREEERLKQNFFDLISHKLMTPLTLALSHGEMFQQGLYGPLNEAQKKAAETIYKQVQMLKAMIVRMLTFITINPENIAASKEEIILAEQFAKTIDPLVKSAGDRKVEVQVVCGNEIKLQMNKNYFELMIGNLVENAVKFSDQEPVKLKIEVAREASRLRISVSDNGPGIPPEEQGNLFKEFYQGEKNFTGQVEGAGLGLALVKKLVELSGGKISLSSNLGQGTTIIIDLPNT